jgi:hypothetical protein
MGGGNRTVKGDATPKNKMKKVFNIYKYTTDTKEGTEEKTCNYEKELLSAHLCWSNFSRQHLCV